MVGLVQSIWVFSVNFLTVSWRHKNKWRCLFSVKFNYKVIIGNKYQTFHVSPFCFDISYRQANICHFSYTCSLFFSSIIYHLQSDMLSVIVLPLDLIFNSLWRKSWWQRCWYNLVMQSLHIYSHSTRNWKQYLSLFLDTRETHCLSKQKKRWHTILTYLMQTC